MHGDRVKARKEFSHYLWQKSHSDKRDFLVISPKGLWVIKLQCLVCHWWPKERLCWQITVKKLEAGTDIGGRKIWQISTRHRPRPAETSEPDVRVPDGARRLACFCSKSWKFNIARANKNSDAAKTWWAPLLPDVLATASETSTLVHLLSCCSFRMILQYWQCPETRIGLTEEAIFFFQCWSTILHPKQLIQNCRVPTKCIPLFTHSQDPLVLSYIASNMATPNKTKLCVLSYYYIGYLRRQSLPCGVIPA